MKICEQCKKEFNNQIKGNRIGLAKRKHCLECIPYLSGLRGKRPFKKRKPRASENRDKLAKSIQEDIDINGLGSENIIKKYKIGYRTLYKLIERKMVRTLTRQEKIEKGFKIKRPSHSEETKKKISEARKKFLAANPDKIPYLLNHSSKESYPEKYFTEVFKKENLCIIPQYNLLTYYLDFAILDKK